MMFYIPLVGSCLLFVAAVPIWIFVSADNRLAALDSRCRTAGADIDVHLKRRADLVPGLVECVSAFAAHETEILGGVVEARAASVAAATPAQDVLGRKVAVAITLAEKYPDLAASPHFRELRGELVQTEERIAAARRFLNLAVEEYNLTRRQFPASVVASLRDWRERRPFDLGVERVALQDPPTLRFPRKSAA